MWAPVEEMGRASTMSSGARIALGSRATNRQERISSCAAKIIGFSANAVADKTVRCALFAAIFLGRPLLPFWIWMIVLPFSSVVDSGKNLWDPCMNLFT